MGEENCLRVIYWTQDNTKSQPVVKCNRHSFNNNNNNIILYKEAKKKSTRHYGGDDDNTYLKIKLEMLH